MSSRHRRTPQRLRTTSPSPCSSAGSDPTKRRRAPLPNHNAPVQTKPPAQPIIGLARLLGMVELAQRLRTSPNAEQPQERAACLTEQSPLASRVEVPTDLGGAAAGKPQTSGGAGGQLLESRMATQASGATASWEESDGDGSSS